MNARIQEINERLNRIKGEKTSILNDIYEKIELESEALTITLNRIDLLLAETEDDIRRKEAEKTGLEKKSKLRGRTSNGSSGCSTKWGTWATPNSS